MNSRDFYPEFSFQTSRSGGAGGQNVNKVETKVALRFHVGNSQLLTEEEKTTLRIRLANQITQNDELLIVSQQERSQLLNKERSVKRFYALLQKALTPVKQRKATKPSAAMVAKRLAAKRMASAKKASRSDRNFNKEE